MIGVFGRSSAAATDWCYSFVPEIVHDNADGEDGSVLRDGRRHLSKCSAVFQAQDEERRVEQRYILSPG